MIDVPDIRTFDRRAEHLFIGFGKFHALVEAVFFPRIIDRYLNDGIEIKAGFCDRFPVFSAAVQKYGQCRENDKKRYFFEHGSFSFHLFPFRQKLSTESFRDRISLFDESHVLFYTYHSHYTL